MNRSALQITIASIVAFSFAAITDTIIYSFLFKQKFLIKANGSNLGGALVDSVFFPIIAVGVFMLFVVLIGCVGAIGVYGDQMDCNSFGGWNPSDFYTVSANLRFSNVTGGK